MAEVSFRDVQKRFGPVEAIRSVSFDIGEGEFVALVGPSGCGKSTLLRMIAGLEEVSDGEILIGGQVVNELTPRERNIAMVFQNYALYPHMTVRDNMGFSLRLKKATQDQIGGAVSRAAGVLGLDTLLRRFPGQLSGGQRQRVAMGRAIVRDSQVFLFDEPLSNLDAQLRVQMRVEIKQLHQTLGNTMVYVTHDQIEAMTMADRIVVMRDGLVEQIGAPLDLYDRPANTFVASFIGSPTMNLLEGRIGREEGAPVFRVEGGAAFPLPGDLPADLEGRKAVYGIRPEHVAIGTGPIEASLRLVEPTGSDMHLVLDAGPSRIFAVSRDRRAATPGTVLRIAPDPAQAHLFDAESGQRLRHGPAS